MKTISEAALRKAILAVEAERVKHPLAFRPDRTQRAGLQKGRRESDAMVAAFLKAGGLDLEKFQALQERRDAELERMVTQHKADSIRRAAKQEASLQAIMTAQTRALRDLVQGHAAPVRYQIERPFLVWSSPLAEMTDNSAEFPPTGPAYPRARFRFTTSQDRGPQKFAFYYHWPNPSSEYAVVSVDAMLATLGHLKAHARWTLGSSSSSLAAYACLNVWSGWPDEVVSVQHGRVLLGEVHALGWFLYGGSARDMWLPWSNPHLQTAAFPVPPGDGVVLEVALQLEYENDGGTIEADFESGYAAIDCLFMYLTVLNSPAGLVTP